jgi:hypothetical protein
MNAAAATKTACTDLTNAQVDQWVKVGNTKRGISGVAAVAAVWKNGSLKIAGDVYVPERDGLKAWRRGENGYRRAYNYIEAFGADESVETVAQQLIAAQQAAEEERKAADARKEAQTQAKIAAARIEFGNGRDIPGSKVARWFDVDGSPRTTLYFAKVEPMYGGVGCTVRIADWQNDSFASTSATSMASAEDAVARWIAAWYDRPL